MKPLPVAGPWITQKEVDAVAEAVGTAWYEDAGLYHARFENAFAAFTGRAHAMALPSCTSAIHLALAALGVGPGDEVIVPDLTWIASAAPITYLDAETVFADVDPDTWCLRPDAVKACLTSRTKAVIAVDLYGGMPDMDGLEALCRDAGVALVEDAAEAAGAAYRGRSAGNFGQVGVFSFHGSKTLTTGEGGMLVTDDATLLERCAVLRDHGRLPGERMFWNGEVAYKYRMSAMQAALGLAQLERFDEIFARKREQFGWYAEVLGGLPGLRLNVEPQGTRNAYWMVTALWEGGPLKEEVIRTLGAEGITTRPIFYPLSELPAYADRPQAKVARERNGVAKALSPRGINLPSALKLERADVHRAAEAFLRVLGKRG